MIKTTEVRCGNYVEYNPDHVDEWTEIKPLQVISIDNEEGTIKLTDGFENFYGEVELNPVPITAEILLKLGVTKSYDEIFDLTFYDLGNVSICSLEGEFTLSGQKMPPMKYVHQLQNLVFILRGKELTINL